MKPRFDGLAIEAAAAFEPSDARPDAVAANLGVARRAGLAALTVPVDAGGHGANLLDFASYQVLLARGDGATALVLAMHHMLLGGEAEAGLWPDGEWRDLCRGAVADGALVNSAATEPGAGSPSQGGLPATRATSADPDAPVTGGSAWRINGRKAYTTGAPYLGFIRVSARIQPRAGEAYGARFLVRQPAPGVEIESNWKPAALAGAANDDVSFSETPASFLYREGRRGCEGTVWFQVAVAATYLGIGLAAQQAAVDFTAARVTSAGRVSDRESVRLRLGRSRAGLEVARRNLLATCAEWVELPATKRELLLADVGLAKVVAVGAAAEAAEAAVRLAGAGGFGAGQPFPRLLLESRAGLSHPPLDDVAYLALAERDLSRRDPRPG